MKYQETVINNIQRTLGDFCLAFFSATVFLLYGTLISFIFDFTSDLVNSFGDYNLEEQFLYALLEIFLMVLLILFVVLFVNLTANLSKKHFLPHILNGVSNKISIIIGIPTLLLLSFIQQFLYQFNDFLLLQTIVFASFICISILLIAFFINAVNYARKQINKNRHFIFNCVAIVLFIFEALILLFIVIFSYDYLNLDLIIAIIVIVMTTFLIITIKTYYTYISEKLALKNESAYLAYPTKVTAYILASKLNKPTIRAMSFSKILHNNIEILCVGNKYNNYGAEMIKEWQKSKLPISLRVFISNRNNIADSVYDYISNVSIKSKRELIAIYIPHFSSNNIIERFMHNQTARKIENRLQRLPNIVISSIPWQRRKIEKKINS